MYTIMNADMNVRFDKKDILRLLLDHIVWFILLLVLIGFSIFIEGFAQWGIYRNIFYHAVFVGILAIAEALCIISRELDLSIESVLGLSAVVTAYLTGSSSDASGLLLNGFLVLGLVLLMGAGIGLFNAFFIVKLRISSFIITLAGYLMFRAAGLILTQGHGVIRLRPEVVAVARTNIGPIPLMIIIMVAVYTLFYVVLTRTRFGRHIYLVGDSREASYNAGIRVDRVLFGVFILSGALSALSGWLLAARTNGSSPGIGMGMLFEAFAAVVIGGVSLQGGVGRLTGVFAGAIVLSAISTAISILGIPAFYMNVIRGGFIIIAVLLDALISRVRPRLL
ncbi:ABC transporter permease [candidate division KSB3 bacterium]|jgi:ribose transport system permease protein|uniref:Autoinducer 2 import system permease protein LsrD n=1 Tax=candidate division KSB3 bacterium TaxID=2044937 RepID=A0A9D5JX23_9BACT|nr:ABC transporter permease [candidate division KSB3 bacterium]MBD3325714.1 ABC transporter permease [candidate division KSB3 bacterium]